MLRGRERSQIPSRRAANPPDMATSGTAAAPRRGGKRPPPTGGGRDSAGRGRGMGSCDAGGERGEGAASPVGIKGSGAAMGEIAAPPPTEVIKRRARPSRQSLQGGEQRQTPLPTLAQKLDWVFTQKERESTKQHLQGGNDTRKRPRYRTWKIRQSFHPRLPQECGTSKKLEQEQTGPPTRTNKSPQPPKDSTAGSRNRRPRQGRSIKEWRGPGRPKGKLRAEGKGHKNIGVFHVFGEGLRASRGKPYNLQLWQPPPTSPPAQREEHCGKQQSK
uniref:Uncharacterized protein n=1 Tax=Oryza rufipogon TaxID=4529 RepID=A0A0E0R8U3_ORYRU